MKKPAGISFIVPAFNCARFLPHAIESIVEGNLSADDEIIIVDDASTDETGEVAHRLAEKHPRLKVIRHRYHRGSAAAGRNTAIESAANDLFFALDADNLLVPDSVPRLVEYLFSKGADAAAFQEVRFFSDRPEAPPYSWIYPEEITLADALAGHQWPGPDGNYLFTKESWLRAGRYDEFVGGGIDSWAFGVRQLATGSRMIALGNTYYLHRQGHNSAWVRDEKEGGQSLKALRALLPFLDHFDAESVEYLFSVEGRNTWFENIPQRSLRVRGLAAGKTGEVRQHPKIKEGFLLRLRRLVARKIAPE